MPGTSAIVLNGIRLLLLVEALIATWRGVLPAIFITLAALAGVVYLLDRAGRLGAPFDLFIQTNRTRFRKVFARKRW